MSKFRMTPTAWCWSFCCFITLMARDGIPFVLCVFLVLYETGIWQRQTSDDQGKGADAK